MADPVTLTGVLALVVIETGKGVRAFINKKNGEDKPGKANICIERGEEVAILKTELKNIVSNQEKMDKKLDRIDKGINGK